MANRSDDQRKAMFANMSNPRSKRKSKRLKRAKRSNSLRKEISTKRSGYILPSKYIKFTMNQRNIKDFMLSDSTKEKNKMWGDMKKQGWVDDKGKLTFISVENKAGLYTPKESKKDIQRLQNLFWSRYDLILHDDFCESGMMDEP